MESRNLDSNVPAFTVMFAVWKALFLREAVARLYAHRTAWLWLLLEPVANIAFLMVMFAVIRVRVIGGINVAVWVMVGLLAFFMFRRTAGQAMSAVGFNRALFSYRQVKPVDTVLVRSSVEGFLTIMIAILLFCGAALMGLPVLPADPLGVMEAVFGLWLLGLGIGLVGSVATDLIPELSHVINFAFRPLYLISGVMFPISVVHQPYRDWLLINPIAHGLEATRLGFAPYYHAVPELNVSYLYVFALVTVFVGLALHNLYAARLVSQ
jgi:capsular polysaccharide transport system permease protein